MAPWVLIYEVRMLTVIVNNFNGFPKNITRVGSLSSVPYTYTVTPLADVVKVVLRDVGLGKI